MSGARTAAEWFERVLTREAHARPLAQVISLHEPGHIRIALTWITRLRWFALLGQAAAIGIAAQGLGLRLPLFWLVFLMTLTAGTNGILRSLLAGGRDLPSALVPGVILLDVFLLTGMLALSGGADNPFCLLYIVHVAMAVLMLPTRGTWSVVCVCVLCYSLLLWEYVPLTSAADRPVQPDSGLLTPAVRGIGGWIAMVLAAGIPAYFMGRLRSALISSESEVDAMKGRISRNEQVASLAALAAGAAHELGTPLGTIALAAHELERAVSREQFPDHAGEDLRLIRSEVERCRTILDRMNIGDISSHDEVPAPVDEAWLRHAIEQELRRADRGQFALMWPEDLVAIRTHRDALSTMLGILVQNGLDASPSPDRFVRLTVVPDDAPGFARFTVEDSGEGMSSSQLARIGEPFVSSKSQQRGMGLGLFLVRILTDQAGGKLTYRSSPGIGTEVHLLWPAARVDSVPAHLRGAEYRGVRDAGLQGPAAALGAGETPVRSGSDDGGDSDAGGDADVPSRPDGDGHPAGWEGGHA